jgi:flagellar protein FliL
VTMLEEAPSTVDAAPSGEADPSGGKGKKGKKDKKDSSAKGKSNLVPAVVLAVGIAAGGYFMGGGTTEAATETIEAVDEAPEPGDVAELDALTVNLAGGRFLRVGVSFLTVKDFEVIHGDPKKGEPSRFKPEYENRLRDQVIAMFAGRQLSDVVGSEQLQDAKAELLERANEVVGDKVLEVYFTEFVTQ